MKRKPAKACERKLPDGYRTQGLYMPEHISAAQMTDEQLSRGLCAKSRGHLEACKACAGGCAFGRLLLARREAGACATTTSTAG